MKRPHFIFCLSHLVFYLLFFTHQSIAQNIGNEWINYNQTYFKIPVGQKGIYRISTTELRQAGFPVGSVDPQAVQLFFRGQEQAIIVQGEADKRFDDADFIEFYGEENDGTQDSLLYIPHSAQPHKIYNLYSDSTAYFLTWRLDGQAGKRMSFYQETNSNNLSPEAYHREDLLVSNIASQNYVGMSEGLMYPLSTAAGAQLAHYDYGEGWSGPEVGKNKAIGKELLLENVVLAGAKPQLEIHLMGRDHRKHRVEVMVGATATLNRTIETAQFEYQYPYLSKKDIEFADIAANKLYINTTSRGATADQSDDVYSITYYRLRYSQGFDFQNKNLKYFYLNPNTTNRSYIEVANAAADARLFDLTNKNNVIRIGATFDNGKLKATITNTASARTLLVSKAILTVSGIQKISFRNIDPAKHNYLIVTHKNLLAATKQYADYRASTAGGKYDTLTVDTDLLVNQFNYGEFSPLAIRRFVQYMAKGNPRFLFFVGRTQQVDFNRTAKDRYLRDMVPTFGWPGSDNMFSHGLKGFPNYVPAIPAGRLWTDSPQTVLNYLDKVKEHEATPMNDLWRKNILHLSGGTTAFELGQFKRFVDEFKQKAQRPYLGAKITTITKKTDEAVEYVGVANELNKGVGLITMFGHSSLSVTDIDVGFVTNDVLGYRNKGRYPLIYANGCVLGNFTFGANTYPVDWIGAKDRGAILFLAHSNLGYSFSLKEYADIFYETLLNDSTNISRPFGEVQQRIIQKYLKDNTDSQIHIADAQELVLQGDPAVVVFPAKQPDYTLTPTNITILSANTAPLTALSDSVAVQLAVSNLSIYRNIPLTIKISRTTRDGLVTVYTKSVKAIAYQDTIVIKIPNNTTQSGLNRFEIVLDPDNAIVEANEQNNSAILEYNLPSVGAYPLLPAEYAIVATTENINLLAQNIDNNSRNYAFELDTTYRFDSPFKKTQTITAAKWPTWTTNILTRDSTTYYWRVRYADRPNDADNRWSESSFSYIKNSGEGWAQRQPAQFAKSGLLQTSLSLTTSPTWTYQKSAVPIKAVLTGNSVGGFAQGFQRTQLTISDLLLVANGNCGNNTIVATALRRSDLRAYSVLPAYNCGNPPYVANALPDAQVINEQLFDKWFDAIPDGDFVLLMTTGNIQFDRWATATKNRLKGFGVSDARLNEMRSGRPYLLIGQKGANQLAVELLTDPEELAPSLKTVSLDNFVLNGRLGNGQIISSVVGPASSWQTLTQNMTQTTNRAYIFDVIGVALDGRETTLLTNQTARTLSLNAINASLYPYLRLRLSLNNPNISIADPAQLRSWIINYTPVAEGSASATIAGTIEKAEGDDLALTATFKNVSNVAFKDSIVVRQTIYTANGTANITDKKIRRLLPNEEVNYALTIPTLGKGGENRVLINFNPKLQPEQNYTNNVINLVLQVVSDRLPPVLDVAFDGQRIRNEEIVSDNPLIKIQLRDENKNYIKTDTTGLNLWLKSPNQANFGRIPLRSNFIKLIPATANNRAYTIEYRPNTLADGLYQLRVQGADAGGNRVVYEIAFRVINEAKLLSVAASPNPAQSLLALAFVVSGKEAPATATFMLTDVLGRVLRTISLQPRIGLNEWIIDPLNLPNGTYYYQLELPNLPLAEGVTKSGKVVVLR
jgi:Peptidase family C25